jgi:hypothetical protein
VLKQNKDNAKNNNGKKANYDLRALPIKQGWSPRLSQSYPIAHSA